MQATELKEFLDRARVQYDIVAHDIAYTAQQTAEYAHISGKDMAKTVIVKIDGKMAMAVLPASEHVDLDLLKAAAGATNAELAEESEFKDRFPHCEVGAMPPFGNLYDMEVYVEERLTEDDKIAFNAGSHTELVKLAYSDFEKLAKPKIVRMAESYVTH